MDTEVVAVVPFHSTYMGNMGEACFQDHSASGDPTDEPNTEGTGTLASQLSGPVEWQRIQEDTQFKSEPRGGFADPMQKAKLPSYTIHQRH